VTLTAPCLCGEPSCPYCGTPVDGTYPPVADCPHPEPAPGAPEWDAWLDSHPYSTTPGIGRVCVPSAAKGVAA
jgi:hypothetical protein